MSRTGSDEPGVAPQRSRSSRKDVTERDGHRPTTTPSGSVLKAARIQISDKPGEDPYSGSAAPRLFLIGAYLASRLFRRVNSV